MEKQIEKSMPEYFSWEVTFFAAGGRVMSYTYARKTPGDALNALWLELASMPEHADFLSKIRQISVRKVSI